LKTKKLATSVVLPGGGVQSAGDILAGSDFPSDDSA
jgi:hypothetical protein